MTEQELLKNKKINYEKLINYGFIKMGDQYSYEKLLNEQFSFKITIDQALNIKTEVFDNLTKEEYLPYKAKDVKGSYVGSIRKACATILDDISLNCLENDVFKATQTLEIIAFANSKYHSKLEFLWEKFDDNAILRRNDTAKWYALICKLPKDKLVKGSSEIVEVLTIRSNPDKISHLVDYKHYFPSYHMNKKHWFSIILDGTIKLDDIYKLLDESYLLATTTKTKNKF